ncbi:hypothetical protein [Dictyobacter kobayashii]|uniref:Uncharacterized protein n=1 Tax=Dictyobacter kobayashii TaxID=2014872 RepID=A0A402AUH9_9CHLR|nr:hypothetical protein [Dictyobacter kobayashii]GCE22771.1 hypothetical protein KDK_65710 [Dictyobacter kobayashii]
MEDTDGNFLEIVTANAPYTGTWAAALRHFLPVIPIAASLISAIIFIVPWTQDQSSLTLWLGPFTPFVGGTVLACLLWMILAAIQRRFTAIDSANANSYDALCKRLKNLDYHIAIAFPDATQQAETYDLLNRLKKGPASKKPATQAAASASQAPDVTKSPVPTTADDNKTITPQTLLLSYRNAIYAGMMEQTTAWVIGTGYIKLWNLMNQAEELLITLEPLDKVVQDAIYDDMRLNQANITNSDEWENKLRAAVAVIDESATNYLKPSTKIPNSTTATTNDNAPEPKPGPQNITPQVEEKQNQARAILQLVREMINSFNTNNWSGLITARNQLINTMMLAGLTTYVATQIAIIIHIKAQHLIGIIIFGLIGALVGLFGRLYQESQAANDIDDYNLGAARLVAAPLLSGLAAIIGVLIVAKVSSLDDLYNVKSILSNFVLAATFGLTPNLVINQLQKQSNQYTGNLKSTQPTSGQ